MRLLIGTKLVLSFTIIILLMLGIGFLSFYSLNRFDDASAVMINEEIPLLIAVSGVENDLLFSRLKLSEYAATGNKAHLQSFNSILDKSNEKILSLKNKPLSQEGLALINEVEKSFGSYKTLSDSFILFYSMNPGDFETISAKEQKIDALLENALISKLNLFQTGIYNGISTSREMIPVVYQQILFLLIIFGVISILIAVAVSFLVSRSVSKPLIKLAGIVPEFAKGNFDKKIDVKSKDETGELAAAFNAMAKDLKLYQNKIKHHEAELGGQVAQQTKELQAKIDELEKMSNMTVGRELRMVELKKRIAVLEKELKMKEKR
jgi:methyl-accepting chemotaxis protein